MRILIAEDEALLRQGMTLLLEAAGHSVVGAAASASELMALLERHHPDLVITDIRMPPSHTDEGLRAAVEIRHSRPGTPVVVLSQHVNRRYARDLLETGSAGVGYLLKQRVMDATTFCMDIERVAAGGTALDPEVVQSMLDAARPNDHALERLTPRQLEVLALVAEGRTNVAIARRLHISAKAVVQHISHIYDNLGLPPSDNDHRRVLAVAHYLDREKR